MLKCYHKFKASAPEMTCDREVYLLRHGTAVSKGLREFSRDSERPLTLKGKKEAKRAGKALKLLGVRPDLILSSPYLRAYQTAEIVSKMIRKEVRLNELLTPNRNVSEVIQALGKKFSGKKKILLVGHEPHLSLLAANFLRTDGHLRINLRKGGLIKLSCDSFLAKGASATLDWLLEPEQLKQIGKK